MTEPAVLTTTSQDGRPAIGYREGSQLAEGYASFEDVFRGPEQLIRDRLRPYLPVLADNGPVLDIGCGRGEMLDLLSQAGVEVQGVDVDPFMVQRAASKGHKVVQQDAIEYLVERSDSSLALSSPPRSLSTCHRTRCCACSGGAHRVLRPGGVLVLETVNPYSLQAFKAFWTDLTHRNPIYPEALIVYCAEAGFHEAQVIFPNGSGDLEKDRWSEGEYAVVARK